MVTAWENNRKIEISLTTVLLIAYLFACHFTSPIYCYKSVLLCGNFMTIKHSGRMFEATITLLTTHILFKTYNTYIDNK